MSLPQLPKSAERGLSLLAKGELVAALQIFDSQLKTAASNQANSNSSSAPNDIQLLQGLAELCQHKLGLPVSSTAGSNQPPVKKPRTGLNRQSGAYGRPTAGASSSAPVSHPMQHLLAALRQGAVGGAAQKLRSGLGVSGYREQRAADAAAVGHALAFLLHPAVYAATAAQDTSGSTRSEPSPAAAVHRCLIDEALAVLASKSKAAFSSTSASPLLSGASGGSQAGSSMEALRTRAGRSKVLLEMLEMTGLEPVKEQMLNLADQVCTVTIAT